MQTLRFQLSIGLVLSVVVGCAQEPDSRLSAKSAASVEPQRIVVRMDDGGAKQRQLSVTVTNPSSHSVQLSSIEASCGCTVVDKWPQQPIPPLGVVKIEVSVSLPDIGRKISQLKLIFVGDDTPRIVLFELHGNAPIIPALKTPLRRVSLNVMTMDQPMQRQLPVQTLEASDASPWLIDASTDLPWMIAEVSPPTERQSEYDGIVERSYKVTLTATRTLETPQLSGFGRVFILTTPGAPVLDSWPVEIVLIPRVRSIPSQLVVSSNISSHEFRVFLVSDLHDLCEDRICIADHPGVDIEAIDAAPGDPPGRKLFLIKIQPQAFIKCPLPKCLVIESSNSREKLGSIPVEVTD